MPVKIRLAKIGKRHAPTYRVVVSKTRAKRNGRAIELLGSYNPAAVKEKLTYDKKAYDAWVAKGAQVSLAVQQLVDGTYTYVAYNPKQEAPKEKEASAEQVEEPAE